jgi:hypothetical protein
MLESEWVDSAFLGELRKGIGGVDYNSGDGKPCRQTTAAISLAGGKLATF